MGVIEQAMIFALGFLVASLMSLLFLPIVSRRAFRLASRRLSMLVPLSMNEIMAERDQIRADHAASSRRLEQHSEALTRDKADAMAESGRHAARAHQLDREVADLGSRNATLRNELEAATRAAHEAQSELALQMQMLHDSLGLSERRGAILNTTQASLAANRALADERQAIIEELEARSTEQDLRIRNAIAKAASIAEDIKVVRANTQAVMAEREVARAEGVALAAKRDALQAELEAARDRIRDGEKRFAVQAEQMAGLAQRLADQGVEVATLQRDLVETRYRRDLIQVERDRLAEAAATREAANQAGETDSLLTSRKEAHSGSEDEIAVLRATLSSLAADLFRVTQDKATDRDDLGGGQDPTHFASREAPADRSTAAPV